LYKISGAIAIANQNTFIVDLRVVECEGISSKKNPEFFKEEAWIILRIEAALYT
jgi:hypothetical protein